MLPFLLAVTLRAAAATPAVLDTVPPPPAPESVVVTELPAPPTAPSDAAGACTAAVNPHRTGCVRADEEALQSGSFLPDGRHIVATVHFAGAPAAPDPASVYTGVQLVLVTTDGTRFPNGDAWKCVTCGMPAANAVGVTAARDYPQTFPDGTRLLAGSTVFDCAPYRLTDPGCTPARMHAYPIHWTVTADGSGPGGRIRELRLHPDGVHLGFNSFTVSGGHLGQFGYLGRLVFDPSPTTGEPRAPRYELARVTRLFQPGRADAVLTRDPGDSTHLRLDTTAITVGEFRNFSKDGREVFYIGYPWEASNIDVFAADLATGRVRRLTRDPEYTDPVDGSPDGNWIVAMDTRGSGRQLFLAAMRGVPPITDLLTSSAVSSVRNNRERRFFQPYLIDRWGERGAYDGQQLNAGDGRPGSISDPNWNGRADPRWSPDGTRVAYWQSLVTVPACGGANPLPCPASTEPGGRRSRLMLARLTRRRPRTFPRPAPIADTVPWGTPYVSGSPMPTRAGLPPGTYTMAGRVSGTARVVLAGGPDGSVDSVAVQYTAYADEPGRVLDGTERVTERRAGPTTSVLDWDADLVQRDASGRVRATKRTSPDGFHLRIDIMAPVFEATGTMTTTVDGHVYTQPKNGT